jgi:hypothetical protein
MHRGQSALRRRRKRGRSETYELVQDVDEDDREERADEGDYTFASDGQGGQKDGRHEDAPSEAVGGRERNEARAQGKSRARCPTYARPITLAVSSRDLLSRSQSVHAKNKGSTLFT